MKNRVFETKVNLYKDIIERHLIANGVPYVVGQDEYFYEIDDIPYRLSIKDEVISIECMATSRAEHYVFPINRTDILLEHYTFSSKSFSSTEITHTKVTSENENLHVTASGIKLDSSSDREACANKIVFFSREVLGNGLFETINRIRFIDNSTPVGVIQDIPRATTRETVLSDMALLEQEIRSDLRKKQTR